jgi:DNA (cytosine-5)-methyltransferase 1
MTQNGIAYALPTLGQPTTVLGSSLLPTPNTFDSLPARSGEAYEKVRNAGGRKNRLNSGNLREAIAHDLLPTPTASDTFTAGLASSQQTLGSLHSVSLAQIVNRPDLLPTPTTQDGKNNGGASQFERKTLPLNAEVMLMKTPLVDDAKNTGHSTKRIPTLASQTYQLEPGKWGKFAAAIYRWEEVTNRPSPDPTKPDGKDGANRLSEYFTEWLMGLPQGWVTDVGLSRSEVIKACGNGVVPQQAELALRVLLENTEIEGINK